MGAPPVTHSIAVFERCDREAGRSPVWRAGNLTGTEDVYAGEPLEANNFCKWVIGGFTADGLQAAGPEDNAELFFIAE